MESCFLEGTQPLGSQARAGARKVDGSVLVTLLSTVTVVCSGTGCQ